MGLLFIIALLVIGLVVWRLAKSASSGNDIQGTVKRISDVCLQIKRGELDRKVLAKLSDEATCDLYKTSDAVKAVAKWFFDTYTLREKPNGDVFFIGDYLSEEEIPEYVNALITGTPAIQNKMKSYTKGLYQNECKLYIHNDN